MAATCRYTIHDNDPDISPGDIVDRKHVADVISLVQSAQRNGERAQVPAKRFALRDKPAMPNPAMKAERKLWPGSPPSPRTSMMVETTDRDPTASSGLDSTVRASDALAAWAMPGCPAGGTLALGPMGVLINPQNVVRDVLVIGASAGGIGAVSELLFGLPPDLPAYIGIVIHRGGSPQTNWSDMFGRRTRLKVVEPDDADTLTPSIVYIAPPDCHMTFQLGRVALNRGPKEHHTRPAIDPLFASAALAYGPRVVGVILTGGGHDGTLGLRHVITAGGISLVQKPSEAEQASMPASALAHEHVHASVTVEQLSDVLVLLARGVEVPLDDAASPSR
jgi:two-component system chemotaxis response regulator CheB